jgi:hypothetical protein
VDSNTRSTARRASLSPSSPIVTEWSCARRADVALATISSLPRSLRDANWRSATAGSDEVGPPKDWEDGWNRHTRIPERTSSSRHRDDADAGHTVHTDALRKTWSLASNFARALETESSTARRDAARADAWTTNPKISLGPSVASGRWSRAEKATQGSSAERITRDSGGWPAIAHALAHSSWWARASDPRRDGDTITRRLLSIAWSSGRAFARHSSFHSNATTIAE